MALAVPSTTTAASTPDTPEALEVDGYPLRLAGVRKLAIREGLYGTPGTNSEDSRIAGRHGVLAGKRTLEAGAFAVKLWLQATTRADLESGYDELLRRTIRTDRLGLWVRTLADGSQRECRGYVADRILPVPFGPTGSIVEFTVVVPSGRWQGPVADTGDLPIGAGGVVHLPQFATATAPMDDLQVILTAPITDGRVVDYRTRRGFTHRAAVSSGTVTIDAATWTAPNVALLDYDGPTFLELQPGDSEQPAVVVTGANTSTATRVRVIGRPGYLA